MTCCKMSKKTVEDLKRVVKAGCKDTWQESRSCGKVIMSWLVAYISEEHIKYISTSNIARTALSSVGVQELLQLEGLYW